MKIKYLDMFAGAGVFRSGPAKVGDFFVPLGWCEIDKYAQRAYRALYDTGGEYFCEDARQINPSDLPDIDLICGGFPCQSFSIAGKRGGFSDARGTLFFEIARIAAACRPSLLLLENVPGLLTIDSGRVFETMLNALSELGYDVAWQVLNSKDFGVQQERKRVYIVGFLREKCAGKVLSFAESYGANYRDEHFAFIDMNPPPTFTEVARCLTTRQNSGIGHRKGERSGVLVTDPPRAIITPQKDKIRQRGRRIKEPNEPMFTLTASDRHGIVEGDRIRNLTPRECFRLQGYTDDQFDTLVAEGIPESQLYKLAGNSVTVNVVEAVGRFLVKEVL